MTDEPDEPTPEQERRIRSALGSARETGPTPDQVVARLDAALADLVTDREPASRRSGETRQRTGRRGRWLLLAGAASVAAIVVLSVPGLRPHGVGGATSAGGTDDSAASKSRGLTDEPRAASPRSGSADREGEPAPPARLASGSFRSDVRRLLSGDRTLSLKQTPSPARPRSGGLTARCPAGTPPPGVTSQRQVLLDGEPALLEVFGARGGARLVRVVSCAGLETLASTRIPAR